MRCAGHVVGIGDRRRIYRILVGNLRERDHVGDGGMDGRIILKWFFRKRYLGEWTGSSLLRMGRAQ